MELDKFIETKLHRAPQLSIKLVTFIELFKAGLPADGSWWQWHRKRIVHELQARGYPVGVRRRVSHVGGLGLQPPATWQEIDGKLVLRRPATEQ